MRCASGDLPDFLFGRKISMISQQTKALHVNNAHLHEKIIK